MAGNGFDSIAQAIIQQKLTMDKLEEENRELRRQLTDLRAGHGIFIEIAGERFPLRGEIPVPQTFTQNAQQQDFSPPVTAPQEALISATSDYMEIPEPTPSQVELAPTMELRQLEDATVEKEEQPKAPTFLEEIMIDEFAASSTSSMAVWKGPDQKQQQEQIDEDQKAALRRELMGSFLLE
ncbi:MAG: hypothetical protein H0V70_22020 [Ktedonobacteraceae bacterium]|nr:hypothetical protein [Ktedonobacteraceae bacterium]